MNDDKVESISAKLRRWADESESDNRRHFYPTFNACDDLGINVSDDDIVSERELFRRIADEVDAEIHESRKDSRETIDNMAWKTVMLIAKGDDIPADKTRKIIERYYLPRPLFDDGEPVQFDDRFVNDSGRNATLSSLNYTKGDHDYVSANGGKIHKVTSRLKCPEPQVLDADGVPIVVGDTVWNVFDDQKRTVIGFGVGKAHVESGPGIEFFEAGHELTHREPDSQERINEDAMKGEYEYWGCNGVECTRCPALVDGKKPKERYGVLWCSGAKTLDLLRRQRELDGRDA